MFTISQEEFEAVAKVAPTMATTIVALRMQNPAMRTKDVADYLGLAVAETMVYESMFLARVQGLRDEKAKRERVIMLYKRVEEIARKHKEI